MKTQRVALLALCGMLESHSDEAPRAWRAMRAPVRTAFGDRASPLADAMRVNDYRAALAAAEHLAALAPGGQA